MSYILGLDGSQFQGLGAAAPDFNQVKAAGYQFWLQRMSYSYPGQPSHFDPSASHNYYAAKNAGLIVGGYHKIGWTDPIVEADFFVNAMSPLSENDLLAHDIEPNSDVQVPANWSEWEQAYVQRIHDRTGVWSIRYLNISMNNAMPPQGCVTNCPSWVAAPSFSWDATLPVSVAVTLQQGPEIHVPGITANVCDTDAFFGTTEQLLKLAYHAEGQNAPVSQPAPSSPQTPPEPSQPTTPATPAPTDNPSETPPEDNPAPGEPTTSPSAPAPENKNETPPHTTPSPAQETPKVVVPEPTYFKVWELVKAIFKKLFGGWK